MACATSGARAAFRGRVKIFSNYFYIVLAFTKTVPIFVRSSIKNAYAHDYEKAITKNVL